MTEAELRHINDLADTKCTQTLDIFAAQTGRNHTHQLRTEAVKWQHDAVDLTMKVARLWHKLLVEGLEFA